MTGLAMWCSYDPMRCSWDRAQPFRTPTRLVIDDAVLFKKRYYRKF
jgi:hypothetical protein